MVGMTNVTMQLVMEQVMVFFYNNEIAKCTADQVFWPDSRDFNSGTFVWSGFDYLGESRGWPQTGKARGTIADLAGFAKESRWWFRSWWYSNISKADHGKPVLWREAVHLDRPGPTIYSRFLGTCSTPSNSNNPCVHQCSLGATLGK